MVGPPQNDSFAEDFLCICGTERCVSEKCGGERCVIERCVAKL